MITPSRATARNRISGRRMISSLVVMLLVLFSTALMASADGEDKVVRVITEEELSSKKGLGGEGDIWLSVLGEVYNVTSGRDFYGEGSGYSVFAGKDASAAFSTGDFTEEGAKKDLDDVPVTQLAGIDGWRKFYADADDKYPQIGVLEGQFYDKEGNPTEKLKTIFERLATHAIVKKEAAEKKKKEAAEKKKKKEL